MLGYEKNEKLEFNYKKSCGLWLIAVAIVIAVATLIGGHQIINMQVFSTGYIVFFFSINMNKNLLKKLSTGSSTKFQNKVSQYSIILLFILMFFFRRSIFCYGELEIDMVGGIISHSIAFFPILFCTWKINDFIRNYVHY